MRKDHTREYATEAYRFYAKVGGNEGYLKKLCADYNTQPSVGAASSTEGALIRKEGILRDHAAEFADLTAVDKALYIIEVNSHSKIKQCVEMVYMKDCWKDIKRGDIEERVHHAELQIPASRSQVFRWLKTARDLFAKERGLRL